jgi:hypothetical protein
VHWQNKLAASVYTGGQIEIASKIQLLNLKATSNHVRLISNARQLVAQAGKTQSVNGAVVGL